MPRFFTSEQRTFMVVTYLRTNSTNQVINEFVRRFPDREPPIKATIFYNVRKYRLHGTSLDRHRGNSGRIRTGRSEENINRVREALEENPRQTLRRNDIGIRRSTLNNIIRLDLRWHPYKMRRRHELKMQDLPRRRAYSEWLVEKFQEDGFLENIIIGDEAAFCMNGTVNTQNVREYAPFNHPPNFSYDVSSSREKVNVWAALCGNGAS